MIGSLAKISHTISTILARSKKKRRSEAPGALARLCIVGHVVTVDLCTRGKVPNNNASNSDIKNRWSTVSSLLRADSISDIFLTRSGDPNPQSGTEVIA